MRSKVKVKYERIKWRSIDIRPSRAKENDTSPIKSRYTSYFSSAYNSALANPACERGQISATSAYRALISFPILATIGGTLYARVASKQSQGQPLSAKRADHHLLQKRVQLPSARHLYSHGPRHGLNAAILSRRNNVVTDD